MVWKLYFVLCEKIISSATGDTKFKITNTKLYVPVVMLSTQDNPKVYEELKSSFKNGIGTNIIQKFQHKYIISI